MILHAIGEERYEVTPADGMLTLNTAFEYSDRGNKRTTTAMLRTKSDFTPIDFEIKNRLPSVHIARSSVDVKEDRSARTFSAPQDYFTIFGPSPFAVQMMMMRYWLAHGRAEALITLRADPAGPLHHRQLNVRPGNSLDERSWRLSRGHDVRRGIADGGGTGRV